MISVDNVKQTSIRTHYQLGTLFYRMLWGPHIHHGYWEADESVRVAQIKLIDKVRELAKIQSREDVLDVGCGMGGSSIYLAKKNECNVTGVTLSPVQKHWATTSARLQGVSKRCRFIAMDAEKTTFQPNSFDVIWSIECTEHLYDKARFFERACQWLRPGGRVAICVWFEGKDSGSAKHRELCEEVCRRFVCPSLGTIADYSGWLVENGLQILHAEDWTPKVAQTWEICKERVQRTGIRTLARIIDREHVEFIDGFDTLLEAYRSGAMQYGVIVAEKMK